MSGCPKLRIYSGWIAGQKILIKRKQLYHAALLADLDDKVLRFGRQDTLFVGMLPTSDGIVVAAIAYWL